MKRTTTKARHRAKRSASARAEARVGTRFDTLAIHAGQEPDPTTGAIMTPVYLTSTYVQDGPGEHKGYEYSRTQNPTRNALQDCLAALEGGEGGWLRLRPRRHGHADAHAGGGRPRRRRDDVYGGTFRLFDKVFKRRGLDVHLRGPLRAGALEAAITPEDEAGLGGDADQPDAQAHRPRAASPRSAQEARHPLVVDNTFMTPYFQRPLELGFDVVTHSTTKYLNGHSDVVGGFVVTDDDGARGADVLPAERGGRRARRRWTASWCCAA